MEIESRTGLVHKQHYRLGRNRARNAEALLLHPPESENRSELELVLNRVPERRAPQDLFHLGSDRTFVAVYAQPEGDIAKDALANV